MIYKRNSFILSFLLLVGIPYISPGQIESSIPETHSNLPVLITIPIPKGEITGSGFLMHEEGKWWYLVTAKHVILEKDTANNIDTLIGKNAILLVQNQNPKDTTINILYVDLKIIQADNRILPHKTADVVLLRLGSCDSINLIALPGTIFLKKASGGIPTRNINMLTCYEDAKLGNSIYVYGYPTSLGMVSSPQFDFHRPLLRKGIIAGKYDKTHTIILDCPIYYGNSGGPVVQESSSGLGLKFKIIGIVTQFIPFDESKANTGTIRPNALYTNSGYGVAESADRILEILR